MRSFAKTSESEVKAKKAAYHPEVVPSTGIPNSNNSAVVHSNEVMLTSVDLNLICGLWFLVLCCRLCFRLAFYLFAKFYDKKLCKMFCEK